MPQRLLFDRPQARLLRLLFAALLAIGMSSVPAWAQRTLNVGVGSAFTSLDPHFHNLTPNNLVASYIFSPLVEFDPSFRPAPALAKSWTAVSDTVWEFKLRPGVLWSDGSPFTADDVVFTFGRVPHVPNSPTSFADAVKPVTQIEVVDPTTIRLHTAEPQPLLPYLLTQVLIVSRKYGEGATTEDYNTGKAAVGTGPYKLASAVIGDHVAFRRNENWWGSEPTWDVVNYRVIANNAARTAALKAGDVDVIDQVPTGDVRVCNATRTSRSPARRANGSSSSISTQAGHSHRWCPARTASRCRTTHSRIRGCARRCRSPLTGNGYAPRSWMVSPCRPGK